MATEPRLGYCCLVSSSNAGNHGRQKKNYYIFDVDDSGLGPQSEK